MSGWRRVASLIPSGTEIVAALGLADTLVGRSHCCDWPPGVEALPELCEAKIDPTRSSMAIDRDVRALMQEGLSVYRVRVDRVRAVAPDVIVTQDHCDACAVSLRDVEEAVACMGLPDARICSLNPHDLAAVEEDFRRVAEAVGHPERGRALARSFRAGLDAVAARTADVAERPRVALVEWLAPPMVAGGWMPELARIAGGEPVMVTDARHFAQVVWEDVEAAEPDVVVVLPCGYDVARTLAELDGSEAGHAVARLGARAPGGAWVVDGDAYFNRPGPRLLDSARLLAAILHPERFPGVLGGFDGAWARWPTAAGDASAPYRTITEPSSKP